MTETRRSRIGREKLSRGAAWARRGTITSRLDMTHDSMSTARAKGHAPLEVPLWSWMEADSGLSQPSGPAVQPGHEPLRVRIGTGGQPDHPLGTCQRGEVARAIRRGRNGPVPSPVVLLEPHRKEVRQRWRDGDRGAERHALDAVRALSEAAAQRRQHITRQTHECRHGVPGQPEYGRPRGSNPEPQRLAGTLCDLVED